MIITESEVRKISKLSAIPCDKDDLLSYMNHLSEIANLFDRLKKVDTSNIDPLYNTNEDHLRLREDKSIKSNTRDDILRNAHYHKHGFYIVPKIIS